MSSPLALIKSSPKIHIRPKRIVAQQQAFVSVPRVQQRPTRRQLIAQFMGTGSTVPIKRSKTDRTTSKVLRSLSSYVAWPNVEFENSDADYPKMKSKA